MTYTFTVTSTAHHLVLGCLDTRADCQPISYPSQYVFRYRSVQYYSKTFGIAEMVRDARPKVMRTSWCL